VRSKGKKLPIKPLSLRLLLSVALFNLLYLQSAHATQQETYLLCGGLSTIATKTHVQKPQASDLTFSLIKSGLNDDQVVMKWWGYEFEAEVSDSEYRAIAPADRDGKVRSFIFLNRFTLQVHALLNYDHEDLRYHEFKGDCSVAGSPRI
jgi:hypothetical protein